MTARDDEAGVSSVVSAVLVFALFTTAMGLWTFTTLPVWIDDREAGHQADVQERMGLLKAGVDALVGSQAPGPVTGVVQLGAPKVPLLQAGASFGTLGYQDGFSFQVGFTGDFLHMQDGVAVGEPDVAAGGPPVSDVQTLQAFTLGLNTDTVGTADSGWVQVVADDGVIATPVTASLMHLDDATGAGCATSGLTLVVTSGLGTRTIPLLCELGPNLPLFAVDLMAQPAFTSPLSDLQPGYDLTVTDGESGAAVASGLYSAIWLDSSGRDQVAGSGQDAAYALNRSGGRLTYEPEYREFPDQTVSYEGGAVLVAQDAGQAVVVEPSFAIDVSGNTGHLRWGLVDLAGVGSRSGSGTATAAVTQAGSTDLLFTVSGATFTLDTRFAVGWRSFLDARILAAGAEAGASIGGTGDLATLTLATGGATGLTSWIVHVQVVDARVAVG